MKWLPRPKSILVITQCYYVKEKMIVRTKEIKQYGWLDWISSWETTCYLKIYLIDKLLNLPGYDILKLPPYYQHLGSHKNYVVDKTDSFSFQLFNPYITNLSPIFPLKSGSVDVCICRNWGKFFPEKEILLNIAVDKQIMFSKDESNSNNFSIIDHYVVFYLYVS